MRIALVFLGRRGGAAGYSRQMAGALACRCTLLAAVSSHADNIASWRSSGLDVVEVPTYRTRVGAVSSLLVPRELLALRARLRAFAPDAIYYPMGHLWGPVLNALLPGVPKVVTVHDPVLHLGERNPVVSLLQGVVIRQCARVIVLSGCFRPVVARRGIPEDRVDVVPHGEFSFYAEARGGSAVARRDGNTLLFFGRISPYKGVGVLLEAFREIEARRPGTRLLLVGSGDLQPFAAQLAAVRGVEIDNRWIDDGEVYPYFSRADVVVLPYVDGSQSGVIPIAYGLGVPVVATRVGGLPDQVADGETGLLVPPGDPAALAAACLRLLESPDLRAAAGRRAAALAASEWSWDAAAARVLASLEAAVTGAGAPASAPSA